MAGCADVKAATLTTQASVKSLPNRIGGCTSRLQGLIRKIRMLELNLSMGTLRAWPSNGGTLHMEE
jgi:hypothetical protein